jgi:hypothetical protein
MIEMTDRFQQTPGLEISKMPDGYVIYLPETDRVVFLNATATVIFELCDGVTTLEEIKNILIAGYELDAFPDFEFGACLNNLVEQGIILRCPS